MRQNGGNHLRQSSTDSGTPHHRPKLKTNGHFTAFMQSRQDQPPPAMDQKPAGLPRSHTVSGPIGTWSILFIKVINILQYGHIFFNVTSIICTNRFIFVSSYSKLRVIRISWDLKIIRISRRKMYWFWSIWPGNLFELRNNSYHAEFSVPPFSCDVGHPGGPTSVGLCWISWTLTASKFFVFLFGLRNYHIYLFHLSSGGFSGRPRCPAPLLNFGASIFHPNKFALRITTGFKHRLGLETTEYVWVCLQSVRFSSCIVQCNWL